MPGIPKEADPVSGSTFQPYLACPLAPNCPVRRFLVYDQLLGWCLQIPVSRLSSALVAWLLLALGIVAVSARTVRRWFKADKLKPWRFRSWVTPKNLAAFLARAEPILDLYARVRSGLDPGEVVESIDEKTSIQARKRTHIPARKGGAPARVEHTYVRAGVVHLFASLNVAAGKVFGQVTLSKNFEAFAQFLTDLISRRIQEGYRRIHLILDNGSTHRPKFLAEWIKRQNFPVEVLLHWTPVRSSWLNQVEIFFSLLQAFALAPNCIDCANEAMRRILGFIDLFNLTSSPFAWEYTSDDLREKHGLPRRQPKPTPKPTRALPPPKARAKNERLVA